MNYTDQKGRVKKYAKKIVVAFPMPVVCGCYIRVIKNKNSSANEKGITGG